MTDAEFFRKQAARCLRLSRTSFDIETSRQLREMAAEFVEKAEEFDGETTSRRTQPAAPKTETWTGTDLPISQREFR